MLAGAEVVWLVARVCWVAWRLCGLGVQEIVFVMEGWRLAMAAGGSGGFARRRYVSRREERSPGCPIHSLSVGPGGGKEDGKHGNDVTIEKDGSRCQGRGARSRSGQKRFGDRR
jgi:hypothetical protein